MNKVTINPIAARPILVQGSIVEDLDGEGDCYIITHAPGTTKWQYLAVSLRDGNRWNEGAPTAEEAVDELRFRVLQPGTKIIIEVRTK